MLLIPPPAPPLATTTVVVNDKDEDEECWRVRMRIAAVQDFEVDAAVIEKNGNNTTVSSTIVLRQK
jgi:hypothetical protein